MEILDSGNRQRFASGAVRDIQEEKGWFHVMPLDIVAEYISGDYVLEQIGMFSSDRETRRLYNALDEFRRNAFKNELDMWLQVSIHYKQGSSKYGKFNWQKGIPVDSYIDSACRHYLKWKYGLKDEPHDRAFVWNILCCIWTIKHLGDVNE